MWYIYDDQGIIVATCSVEPDAADLATRGEAAFFHPQLFELGWKVIFDEEGRPSGAEPVEESPEEKDGDE